MPAQFNERGVRFRYPENWTLERQESESGWSVVLQSPETAFLLLSLHEDMPETEELAETALGSLREEYADLDADERVDSIAGQPAIGHDIRFFALDLTNTCWTRSFFCGAGTALLICQFNDLEAERNEPVLRAICKSLEVDD